MADKQQVRVVVDHDSDMVRLYDGDQHKDYRMRGSRMDSIESMLSDVIDRVVIPGQVSVTLDKQSEGEITNVEEW